MDVADLKIFGVRLENEINGIETYPRNRPPSYFFYRITGSKNVDIPAKFIEKCPSSIIAPRVLTLKKSQEFLLRKSGTQ
jgi:hypothetical protein